VYIQVGPRNLATANVLDFLNQVLSVKALKYYTSVINSICVAT